MKTKLVAGGLLAGVLAVCLPMWAHHGNAAYDMTEVELKGAKVTDFLWANPHTIITFDTKDDNGKVLHWAGELGSPSALANLGWSKASIAPGDMITVYIHQSKTGNPVGRITHIELADGTKLSDSGGAGAAGAAGGRGGRGGRGGEYQ
jgi:Family of unknown function (DUF6152)